MSRPQETIELRLPADARSARLARHAITAALRDQACDADLDDVALLATELVTNAIRHGEPPIALVVTLRDDVLRVEVLDGSPEPVRPRHAGPMAQGGRGLELVESLAARWGSERLSGDDGKVVWFEVDCGPRGA